jgi:hypothetical protein
MLRIDHISASGQGLFRKAAEKQTRPNFDLAKPSFIFPTILSPHPISLLSSQYVTPSSSSAPLNLPIYQPLSAAACEIKISGPAVFTVASRQTNDPMLSLGQMHGKVRQGRPEQSVLSCSMVGMSRVFEIANTVRVTGP